MAGSVCVVSELGVGTQFIISFRTTCKLTKNQLTQDNRYSEQKKIEAEEILMSSGSSLNASFKSGKSKISDGDESHRS
jgi:hypothetical protein